MKNQNNLEKKNNLLLKLLKQSWTLPQLLGVIGLVIFLFCSLFLSDILFSGFLWVSLFWIIFGLFPLLIALIAIIKIRTKPIISGIFMFLVGWGYCFLFPLWGCEGFYFFLILLSSFLLLISGGILSVSRSEKILEAQGKKVSKHCETIKFLLIMFSFIMFLFFMWMMLIGARPMDDVRNTNRKSDMRQVITAQEMYYGANDHYLTLPSPKEGGIPAIPNYSDEMHDEKKRHSDYVWLNNTNCENDGEHFCAYAFFEGKPIKYYGASERGTKELNFIPGSIGGVYGIDHCDCWQGKQKQNSNKELEIAEYIIDEKQKSEQIKKPEQVVSRFYRCYIAERLNKNLSLELAINNCNMLEENYKQFLFEKEVHLADPIIWAQDYPDENDIQIEDIKIKNDSALLIVAFLPKEFWLDHKVKVSLLLEDNEWKISNIERYK